MKKLSLISILLVLLLVPGLMFVGCSKEEAPAAAAPAAEKAAETTPVVEANPVKEAALAYFANFPGNRIIASADVFAKIDAGEDMLLLDIRKAEDYAAGHLKGAVNAPWGPAITAALEWLPDDKPVYVNCYSGQTAGQAVAALNVAGIQASSVKYGYSLGVAKTEGYEAYQETTANAAPEASGVKYDAAIKSAVADYFNAIPEGGSNIWPAAKVKEALDAEEDIFVLSIRQQDAYDAGHIEGAALIPWAKGMQEQFADVIPMDKQVVVHCYSGQTAGQAVAILRLLGYNAVSMKSGMGTPVTGASGWANEGFPVVQ
ncbi:MAG: rhodanese-like domain-containing protein [Spirochaetales bacterium]|nr:rhodanese-like domain-containing protein [Spirochaetales bacterium]